MSLWQRVVGWWSAKRSLAAAAERECIHDGSEPMCFDCFRNWTA